MIRCLLIDDESASRNVLRTLLEKSFPEMTICGEASSAAEGLEKIAEYQPNLVFLDIQMPGGSGFDLLRGVERVNFEVIFVTGFDQYAITAIKFNALDYLLKPVDRKELFAAVQKATERIREKNSSNAGVSNLLADEQASVLEKRIALHDRGTVQFVKINEIMYVEADINYSVVNLVNGHRITASKTLKDMEEMLSPSDIFIRLNKSELVNINFVKFYSKKDPMKLTLVDGREFAISRRKKHEVNEKLKQKLIIEK